MTGRALNKRLGHAFALGTKPHGSGQAAVAAAGIEVFVIGLKEAQGCR